MSTVAAPSTTSLVTIAELAELLGVSGMQVRRLCWHAYVRRVRVSERVYYDRDEALAAVARQAGSR